MKPLSTIAVESGFMESNISLPETVEIAVRVYGEGLFIFEGETYDGRFAYLKVLTLTALIRLEIHPENAVFRKHGMFYGADRYVDDVAFHLYGGDMLFVACFHHTGFQLLHFLSAAHQGYSRIVDHAYQIAAMFANIKFLITHHKILRFVFYFKLIVIRFVTVFCLYFYYALFSEKFCDFVTLFADR